MNQEQAYLRPRTILGMSQAIGILAVVAAIAGPVYAINAMTRAGAHVRVPVELAVPADGSADDPAAVDVAVSGLPEGAVVSAARDELSLRAWDSTMLEQMLSRGHLAVLGLSLGVGALLVRPVLESVGAGRPFGTRNSRRIAGIAAAVFVAAEIGPLLPNVASLLVLSRLGLDRSGGPFTPGLTIPLLPLIAIAFLLVLAEAFRRGEQIDADLEGLV